MNGSLISRLAVCAVAVIFSTAAQAADPVLPPALKAEVQVILHSSQAVGASVILVDALGVSASYLHGNARADTCHPAGAAGDALVALAAMRLAERGKVDLYAALPKSVGVSVGMPVSSACNGKSKVTLSLLLEHTSGLGGPSGQSNACSGGVNA